MVQTKGMGPKVGKTGGCLKVRRLGSFHWRDDLPGLA